MRTKKPLSLSPQEVELMISALATHLVQVQEQFKYWRKLEKIQGKIYQSAEYHFQQAEATRKLLRRFKAYSKGVL